MSVLIHPYFLLIEANHSFLQEFVIKNFTQSLDLLKLPSSKHMILASYALFYFSSKYIFHVGYKKDSFCHWDCDLCVIKDDNLYRYIFFLNFNTLHYWKPL